MNNSAEYQFYQYLKHWKKESDLEKLKLLINESAMFNYLFRKVEELYSKLPLRKEGLHPLTHPLNVVLALKQARIDDEITLCVGLLHDFVEEKVDLYKYVYKIEKNPSGIKLLDQQEIIFFTELKQELEKFGEAGKIIIATLKLLTRHKRDFYYQSISNLFGNENEHVKEIAIRVKLADRMHNILCLSCFTKEQRLYECFKNLFILNNAKKHLLEKPEERISKFYDPKPTELLFKRCSKSTYNAFLTICEQWLGEDIKETKSMIQLAFQKFAFEKSGLWAVTKVDSNEAHLFRLFQGVIRKYDARLHLEWDKYNSMKEAECEYCRRFFRDFNYNEDQILAIINYKDAYALKQVVAYLLYQPEYVISQFLSSELTDKARIYDLPNTV